PDSPQPVVLGSLDPPDGPTRDRGGRALGGYASRPGRVGPGAVGPRDDRAVGRAAAGAAGPGRRGGRRQTALWTWRRLPALRRHHRPAKGPLHTGARARVLASVPLPR